MTNAPGTPARSMRLLVVLFTTAAAFRSVTPRVSQGAAKAPSRRRVTTAMMMPPGLLLAPAARLAASLPVMYSLMSVNEYVTHRYFQHAGFNSSPWLQAIAKVIAFPFRAEVPVVRGGGHVEHHAETLDDMTLKTDSRWRSNPVAKMLDDDEYRGTGFTWAVSGLMAIQMLPTTLPVFKYLLGYSLPATFAILLPGMLLHTLVWNALHPNMHALPDVTWRVGPPSSILAGLRKTAYFKFLYTNHEGHHVVGGRGNYNVACPGTDHLVGTFIPEKTWRPRATTTYASHHGEDIDLEQQIKNAVARSSFGLSGEEEIVVKEQEEKVLELV